jgi:hypothetical protein
MLNQISLKEESLSCHNVRLQSSFSHILNALFHHVSSTTRNLGTLGRAQPLESLHGLRSAEFTIYPSIS